MSPLLAFWWGTFLIANWLTKIALRYHQDTLADRRPTNGIYLGAGGIDIIAAVAAVLVLKTLTAREERRAVQVASTESR